MGIYLVHVRTKIAIEHADEVLEALWEDGANCLQLPGGGDTVHLLMEHRISAGHLRGQLAKALSHSMVEDFGIVEITPNISESEPEPSEAEGGSDSEYDEDGEFDLVTASQWLADNASPRPTVPGLQRRGLLVMSEIERTECHQFKLLDLALSEGAARHWHGRSSLLYTYWDNRRIEHVLASGKLADIAAHRNISAAFAFELLNDLVTMHGSNSTLEAWYRRLPTDLPQRPSRPKAPAGEQPQPHRAAPKFRVEHLRRKRIG